MGFVFFNYFIMANFFWLLVEGLYLHALLLLTHTCCSRLAVYMLIGWGRHTRTHTMNTHTHRNCDGDTQRLSHTQCKADENRQEQLSYSECRTHTDTDTHSLDSSPDSSTFSLSCCSKTRPYHVSTHLCVSLRNPVSVHGGVGDLPGEAGGHWVRETHTCCSTIYCSRPLVATVVRCAQP